MKKYSEYKDTGLSWCSSIPSHWKLKRNKGLFFQRKEKSLDGYGDLLSLSQYKGITLNDSCESGIYRADSLVGYNKVYPQDIVMNIMLAWNGSTAMSGISGLISPAYAVFYKASEEVCEKYFHYLFKIPSVLKYFEDHSTGIIKSRLRLYPEIFLKLLSLVPPIDEQKQIVAYLDSKISKIDKLIDTKRKEIAVLEEYRQGVINKAVTRGLNPDVELKDSGIEWIGEIPSHWKIVTVRRLYSSILGKMLQPERKKFDDKEKEYICAKDVHFSGIDISDLKKMWFSTEEQKNYKVIQGDLLVVEGGAGAGGCAIFEYDKECYVQNSIHIVRSKGKATTKFLNYWTQCLVKRGYIDYACNKATIPHFTKEKLMNMPIADIPIHEAENIVLFIDKQNKIIDHKVSNFKQKISLLEEYRTRLISDVVTGQIDVR